MTGCKHAYVRCPDHHDYEVCQFCATYHSLSAPPPEEVYTADYWSHSKNHSTLQEQIFNVNEYTENGVSKNDFVLNLIDVEDRSAALEIGCAPGSLLGRLRDDAGFARVSGIEAIYQDLPAIAEIAGEGVYLCAGVFPRLAIQMDASQFNLIVSCDCFEHSHEPEAFLAECARLLKPGGQLILMLPLAGIGDIPERMFNPTEHVYIHDAGNLGEMLLDAGFEAPAKGDIWCPGHETISARRAT